MLSPKLSPMLSPTKFQPRRRSHEVPTLFSWAGEVLQLCNTSGMKFPRPSFFSLPFFPPSSGFAWRDMKGLRLRFSFTSCGVEGASVHWGIFQRFARSCDNKPEALFESRQGFQFLLLRDTTEWPPGRILSSAPLLFIDVREQLYDRRWLNRLCTYSITPMVLPSDGTADMCSLRTVSGFKSVVRSLIKQENFSVL